VYGLLPGLPWSDWVGDSFLARERGSGYTVFLAGLVRGQDAGEGRDACGRGGTMRAAAGCVQARGQDADARVCAGSRGGLGY
jgi:hypothetical protein